MFLHDAQELDDDLGAGADENLAFAGFFGIVDGVKRIVEHTCFDHVRRSGRFSTRWWEMRYLLSARGNPR